MVQIFNKIKGIRYIFWGGNSLKLFLPTFWKGVYPKRKEFAPLGNKLFFFSEVSFSEGDLCAEKQKQEVTKVIYLVKIYNVYLLPLTFSAPNFRRHLSSALFFFFLFNKLSINKLSLRKKLICKVKSLNVKQCRSRWNDSGAVSSGSTLFAKAYDYRLWQWKS